MSDNGKLEISEKLKKRFTKDMDVPIKVLRAPYFSYYIDLFDEFFDTKNKYDSFLSTLSQLGNEEVFFEESSAIINGAINQIKKSSSYEKYTSADMSIYTKYPSLVSKPIYAPDNNQHLFISLDLKHANFQALKYVDEELTLGAKTYEQLLAKFTQLPYFIKSKQIRQIIFGHLNPKRQRTIQKKLVYDIYSYFINIFDFFSSSIATSSPDELVVDVTNQVTDKASYQGMFKEFEQSLASSPYNKQIHLNAFILHQLEPHNFYVRQNLWSNASSFKPLSIKNTPIVFIPQIIKHIKGQEVEFEDLLFIYEKRLCKFVNPLNFEKDFSFSLF
ncbi:MAG: hypothetical protein ACFFC7_29005 [Candidatus Hermodarchaeota archaeon]